MFRMPPGIVGLSTDTVIHATHINNNQNKFQCGQHIEMAVSHKDPVNPLCLLNYAILFAHNYHIDGSLLKLPTVTNVQLNIRQKVQETK